MANNRTLEDKAQFIELRALGYSYRTISEKMGISKPTLIGWAKDLDREIKEQRALEMQTLIERHKAGKMARVEGFAKLLDGVNSEIEKRLEAGALDDVNTDKLLDMSLKLDKKLSEETQAGSMEYGMLVEDKTAFDTTVISFD